MSVELDELVAWPTAGLGSAKRANPDISRRQISGRRIGLIHDDDVRYAYFLGTIGNDLQNCTQP